MSIVHKHTHYCSASGAFIPGWFPASEMKLLSQSAKNKIHVHIRRKGRYNYGRMFVHIGLLMYVRCGLCYLRRFYMNKKIQVSPHHIYVTRKLRPKKLDSLPVRTENFLFATASRPVLWTIQAPIQLGPADQLLSLHCLVVFVSSP